jgi:arginase
VALQAGLFGQQVQPPLGQLPDPLAVPSGHGRNTGPIVDQAAEALTAAARDQRMRTLSIGELNPTRCAGDPEALARFVTSVHPHTHSHNSLIIKSCDAMTDLEPGATGSI